MTHEEFLKVVRERTAGRIEVLSEYEGSLEKVSVKDTVCGHEWEVVATRITKNYGCPTCGRYEWIIEYILWNRGITPS